MRFDSLTDRIVAAQSYFKMGKNIKGRYTPHVYTVQYDPLYDLNKICPIEVCASC